MPLFVVLGQFTDQGIKNIKETTKRAQAFREIAKKSGATVKEVYWTLGQYDLVSIVEAEDASALTGLLLTVGGLGNVRTQSLRAFTADEMDQIIAKMA